MDITFNVDNEIKQDFLETKPTETAKSESFVLRAADEYEEMINKSIYNMTYAELYEMLAMQFKNTSDKVVSKNVSILKTYIDFCINKNIVLHGENRFATFTPKKAKEFVSKQALINKYVTKEKFRVYQNILNNEQDKLLIELPFVGARGRTTEDGTLEEIINLRISDVDEENRMIRLTQNNGKHRYLEVDLSTIELIKETYKQKIYYENNDELTNNKRLSKPREISINEFEDYVLRVPSKNKFSIFTSNLLNSRMRRIQKYLDNRYITFTSLYQSGMINMCFDIYNEKGEVTKEDYVRICDRFGYGSEPEKYWFSIKALFEQYKELLEKHPTLK